MIIQAIKIMHIVGAQWNSEALGCMDPFAINYDENATMMTAVVTI